MDPDTNLAEQRRIKDKVKAGKADRYDRTRLRELQAALREWRGRGGFGPREAQRETWDVRVGRRVVKRGFYTRNNADDYAARVGGVVERGATRA